MKHSSLADLLKRYLRDDTSAGETWTVDQWYEARDMPRPPAPTPAEQAAAKARAWQRIQARTRPRPVVWQRPAVRWAAAATLLLGLSLGWLGLERRPAAGLAVEPTRVGQLTTTAEAGGWRTSTNQTTAALPLALSDGSTVTLRPGGRLRYPAQFAAGHERVVELRGEAFFDVFHEAGRRFRVLTPQLETTVLGTSFWVRAVPGQAQATVQVRTGAVRVRVRPRTPAPTGLKAVVLRPNQQVVYSATAPVLRPMLVAAPALLHAQPLHFEERPVAEVLASLQAGYGVPIRYDGAALAGCTVSLSFGSEDLFGKLNLLCKTLGASYERTDDALIFRSRGCLSE